MDNAKLSVNITGVILAGGRGRRMGDKDKGLLRLAGIQLVERGIRILEPLVDQVVISANRNISQYESLGCPIITDTSDSYEGPLAGLQQALNATKGTAIFVLPCDAPLFTKEMAHRLIETFQQGRHAAVVAHDGARLQPLFGIFSVNTRESLNAYIESGHRKVESWVRSLSYQAVDFSGEADSFMNINTKEDLVRAESLVSQQQQQQQ